LRKSLSQNKFIPKTLAPSYVFLLVSRTNWRALGKILDLIRRQRG
jgi:hypothetical protein